MQSIQESQKILHIYKTVHNGGNRLKCTSSSELQWWADISHPWDLSYLSRSWYHAHALIYNGYISVDSCKLGSERLCSFLRRPECRPVAAGGMLGFFAKLAWNNVLCIPCISGSEDAVYTHGSSLQGMSWKGLCGVLRMFTFPIEIQEALLIQQTYRWCSVPSIRALLARIYTSKDTKYDVHIHSLLGTLWCSVWILQKLWLVVHFTLGSAHPAQSQTKCNSEVDLFNSICYLEKKNDNGEMTHIIYLTRHLYMCIVGLMECRGAALAGAYVRGKSLRKAALSIRLTVCAGPIAPIEVSKN